jgi:hypothetical protein
MDDTFSPVGVIRRPVAQVENFRRKFEAWVKESIKEQSMGKLYNLF